MINTPRWPRTEDKNNEMRKDDKKKGRNGSIKGIYTRRLIINSFYYTCMIIVISFLKKYTVYYLY